ncbi:MAG: tetratricopeptide repeat protein [Chloroflexi bacterium]|nr:tetratricopeptide repeat protein [Chloroflexota bacterium]
MELLGRLFRRRKLSALQWLRQGQKALDQGYQELANRAQGNVALQEGEENLPTGDAAPNMAARDFFKNALEVDPSDPVAWSYLGLSQWLLGQRRRALVSFGKALELEPNFASVWFYQGLTQASLRNHREAIRCFQRALELDPANIDAWISQGQSLTEVKDQEGAVACFRRALELDPADDVARLSLL